MVIVDGLSDELNALPQNLLQLSKDLSRKNPEEVNQMISTINRAFGVFDMQRIEIENRLRKDIMPHLLSHLADITGEALDYEYKIVERNDVGINTYEFNGSIIKRVEFRVKNDFLDAMFRRYENPDDFNELRKLNVHDLVGISIFVNEKNEKYPFKEENKLVYKVKGLLEKKNDNYFPVNFTNTYRFDLPDSVSPLEATVLHETISNIKHGEVDIDIMKFSNDKYAQFFMDYCSKDCTRTEGNFQICKDSYSGIERDFIFRHKDLVIRFEPKHYFHKDKDHLTDIVMLYSKEILPIIIDKYDRALRSFYDLPSRWKINRIIPSMSGFNPSLVMDTEESCALNVHTYQDETSCKKHKIFFHESARFSPSVPKAVRLVKGVKHAEVFKYRNIEGNFKYLIHPDGENIIIECSSRTDVDKTIKLITKNFDFPDLEKQLRIVEDCAIYIDQNMVDYDPTPLQTSRSFLDRYRSHVTDLGILRDVFSWKDRYKKPKAQKIDGFLWEYKEQKIILDISNLGVAELQLKGHLQNELQESKESPYSHDKYRFKENGTVKNTLKRLIIEASKTKDEEKRMDKFRQIKDHCVSEVIYSAMNKGIESLLKADEKSFDEVCSKLEDKLIEWKSELHQEASQKQSKNLINLFLSYINKGFGSDHYFRDSLKLWESFYTAGLPVPFVHDIFVRAWNLDMKDLGEKLNGCRSLDEINELVSYNLDRYQAMLDDYIEKADLVSEDKSIVLSKLLELSYSYISISKDTLPIDTIWESMKFMEGKTTSEVISGIDYLISSVGDEEGVGQDFKNIMLNVYSTRMAKGIMDILDMTKGRTKNKQMYRLVALSLFKDLLDVEKQTGNYQLSEIIRDKYMEMKKFMYQPRNLRYKDVSSIFSKNGKVHEKRITPLKKICKENIGSSLYLDKVISVARSYLDAMDS